MTPLAQASWRRRPATTLFRIALSLLRRRLPTWRQVVVPYDEGRSRIVADLSTALGLCLYRYGYQDNDLDLVRQLLQPGDMFVDGGANVGLFTLVAARQVGPSGKVVAFEPAPWSLQALRRNLAVNDYPWVDIVPLALADKAGTTELIAFQGDAAGYSSFAPPARAGGNLVPVATATLDTLVPESDRKMLTLVKLDLEGAEYRALQGARAILSVPGPDFIIEVEPEHLSRQGASVGQLMELFNGAGYHAFRIAKGSAGTACLTQVGSTSAAGTSPNLFMTKDPARAKDRGVDVSRLNRTKQPQPRPAIPQ
jgi:FkbM family methyltransferase